METKDNALDHRMLTVPNPGHILKKREDRTTLIDIRKKKNPRK